MAREISVLITRPQPDADALAQRLSRMGYAPIVAPMTRLEREEREDVSALENRGGAVFTSANGVRSIAEDIPRTVLTGLPNRFVAYCVGARTATAADEAGFANVISADGDASDLIALLRRCEAKRLALFRGEAVAVDLQAALPEIDFEDHVLYRARPVEEMPAALRTQHSVDVALFLSERAAAGFAALARDRNWSQPVALCLSARIAEPLTSLKFRQVDVASRPGLSDLLALLPPLSKAS